MFGKLKQYFSVIKTLFKIKSEVSKMEKIKAGYKTTEFWLSALTILLTGLAAASGMLSAELVAKIGAAIVMVYTVARAIIKFTPSQKDDEILAKFEAILKEKGILPK